jgi:signal transduction histidine kinase
MVDALEDGVVSEPVEMKRYFVTIRRDVDRLNRMIDDLFDLAQLDAGAMRLRRQRVSVQEVVAEVVDSLRVRAERDGISVSLSIEHEMPASMLDADRLERAVANLVRNAIEHSPVGGSVCVYVRSSDGHAVLEVSDSGAGIDEADMPHIWTRFYRGERSRQRADAESDGVGLGLAITKGIVELHGGTVAVRSTRGEGSSFQVLLPLVDP